MYWDALTAAGVYVSVVMLSMMVLLHSDILD